MEYAVLPLPNRKVISFQIRILGGLCMEPSDRLGVARLVEETLDKGTEQRDGRSLSDAFDRIGAVRGSATGRETTTFSCTVLPEYVEQAVALHAELIRTPTFPLDAFTVNRDLARQELTALEDDPQALVDRMISRAAYGPVLGRHALGDPQTLDDITVTDARTFWNHVFASGRMLLTVAGGGEPRMITDLFERHFAGFGASTASGRDSWPIDFSPQRNHRQKDLEQEQISICFPGVDAAHPRFPVQQVVLGILSGGMSGRLFTEVREKQGLVYWVSAWQETPRGSGMIFLGASTTPERCDKTFSTLLREVDRLSDDVTDEELDRAVTGILAAQDTRGDSTRARCAELMSDLFFYGRPIDVEEKNARLKAVTTEHVRRFLVEQPRDRLCIATLGPRELDDVKRDS